MATNITGKNIDLTESMKTYVHDKLQTLHNHSNEIIEIDVECDRDPHHHKGEVFHVRMNVQVPNELLHADENAESFHAAVDACMHDVDRQIRKHKEKRMAQQRKEQKERRAMKEASTALD